MIKYKKGPIFGLRRASFAGLVFFAAVSVPAGSEKPSRSDLIQDRTVEVYSANKDCAVKVTAEKRDEAGRTHLETCSGFLSSKDGHVVTSAFVTYKSTRLWVEWKGILLEAENVGHDPLTTLSVIKLKNGFASRKASFANFDSQTRIPPIASPVILISRELGLPPTPRMGLVAGHDINFGDLLLPAVYLRTNIPSFEGSIGSPAFDFDGNFVGMLVASLPSTGGSFLMPAKAVARIRDDIILCGEPVYGWFGLRAVDGDDSQKAHVTVDFVIQNSPADKAGFKVGDVILEINGAVIDNNTQLRNITFYVRPGDTARFKVLRGTETKNLDLIVEKMNSEVISASAQKLEPKKPEKEVKEEAESSDIPEPTE